MAWSLAVRTPSIGKGLLPFYVSNPAWGKRVQNILDGWSLQQLRRGEKPFPTKTGRLACTITSSDDSTTTRRPPHQGWVRAIFSTAGLWEMWLVYSARTGRSVDTSQLDLIGEIHGQGPDRLGQFLELDHDGQSGPTRLGGIG